MSQLLAKGAEAHLFLEDWYGYQVVRKHRIPKNYRFVEFDKVLRNERTIREARLLSTARRLGVRTPIVFRILLEEATLIMEYIPGKRLKDVLASLSTQKQQHFFIQIGKAVGFLHQGGIAHGDLTTSNMILHPLGLIYFIDFGLATTTRAIEDFGMDLHLLRRALLSAHYHQWVRCFKAFQKGYTVIRNMAATDVFQKIDEIESRGRYISERYG